MSLTINGAEGLSFEANISMRDFAMQIKQMQDQIKGVANTANKEGAAVEGFAKKAALAIGSYTSLMGVSNLVGDIVKVRGEFQKFSAVLTNTLGNKDLADNALTMIADYAATTPYQLSALAGSFIKLTNQGLQPTKREMQALGDLAAATGKDFDQLAEALIDGATSSEFERLKELGIRASKSGDQVKFTFRGVSTEVQNTSKAIKDYIISLGQMQGVAGSTAAISATLEGKISNLQDAWASMLNQVGQANEGAFSTAIEGASFLVQNYQTVIDILGVMVTMYGTYRAALAATVALKAIDATITGKATIAERLRAGATLVSDKAMKLLNATMLANPAVAVSVVVAGLAAGLYLFSKSADDASKAQEALNGVQLEAAKSIEAEKQKLEKLVAIAKDETRSKQQRESAIRKINELSPQYLGNLTAENIKTAEGTAILNAYTDALEKKAKAQAANAALEKLYQERLEIQSKGKTADNVGYGDVAKTVVTGLFGSTQSQVEDLVKANKKNTDDLLAQNQKQIDAIKKTYKDALEVELLGEGEKQDAKQRTIAVIDAEIKKLKDQQSEQSTSRKQYTDFQNQIIKLEAEKERITGKQAQKNAVKTAKEIDQRTEQLKALNEAIADTQREATRSGLVKEESELDKLSQRYDDLVARAKELKASEAVFDQIEATRQQHIGNVKQKNQVEDYKKQIEEQKQIFEQFETYKTDLGEEQAKKLTNFQTADFDSYLHYLETQLALSTMDKTLRGKLKVAFLAEEIKNAKKEDTKKEADAIAASTEAVMKATLTSSAKRLKIEEKYLKDVELLKKNYSGKDFEDRKNILDQNKNDELAALRVAEVEYSEVYRKINQNILFHSRERIKQEIADLKKALKSGKITLADGSTQDLTDQMRKDIEGGIKRLQAFYKETGKVLGQSSEKLQEMAGKAFEVAGMFTAMSQAVAPLDQNLSDALSQVSDMANVAGNALSSFASFAAGDIAGGISSAMNAIAAILTVIKQSKETALKAAEDIAEFNLKVLQGEVDINIQYRERQRLQDAINVSKLEGLAIDKKTLEEQRKASQEEYARILKQLEQEQYVAGEKSKKGKGSLLFGLVGYFTGLGAKTTVQQELNSLVGKSYEDLEKLFATGQLTDKAKELFQTLQKLKQEGADLDAQLDALRKETQQIFTGTTADSLLDGITDMFRQGKIGAEDFAAYFQDQMKNAMLQTLKFKYMEGPLKEFYAQFAAASESDGVLTVGEIAGLQTQYNQYVSDFTKKFEDLKQITGLNFSEISGGAGSTLQTAIRGMTEQQSEVLSGQIGGMRLSNLEILKVSQQSLQAQLRIQANTAATVNELTKVVSRLDNVITGSNWINVKIK